MSEISAVPVAVYRNAIEESRKLKPEIPLKGIDGIPLRDEIEWELLLGIHGESMGAAILLLYAGMDGKADFYIADCPYSTILDQLLYRMKVEYGIQFAPLMHLVAWIVYLRAGFRLMDVNCLEAVKKVEKPILFIHGSEADYFLSILTCRSTPSKLCSHVSLQLYTLSRKCTKQKQH